MLQQAKRQVERSGKAFDNNALAHNARKSPSKSTKIGAGDPRGVSNKSPKKGDRVPSRTQHQSMDANAPGSNLRGENGRAQSRERNGGKSHSGKTTIYSNMRDISISSKDISSEPAGGRGGAAAGDHHHNYHHHNQSSASQPHHHNHHHAGGNQANHNQGEGNKRVRTGRKGQSDDNVNHGHVLNHHRDYAHLPDPHHQEYLHSELQRNESELENRIVEASAIFIQKWVRGFLARKRFREFLISLLERQYSMHEGEYDQPEEEDEDEYPIDDQGQRGYENDYDPNYALVNNNNRNRFNQYEHNNVGNLPHTQYNNRDVARQPERTNYPGHGAHGFDRNDRKIKTKLDNLNLDLQDIEMSQTDPSVGVFSHNRDLT
jgi:hypothetical protein